MTKQESAIYVTIDERMHPDRSLKKFKRMCEAFGVVREYRKRQEYRKPSVRLKEKTEAAVKRLNKNKSRTRRAKI